MSEPTTIPAGTKIYPYSTPDGIIQLVPLKALTAVSVERDALKHEVNHLRQSVADLNQRLIERTQDMLSKQTELIQEARQAKREARDAQAELAALPERPQAQPGPWPGQQEAIDQAFEEVRAAHLVTPKTGDDYAPARIAIAQAYDKARPQSAEIAKLKSQIGHLEERDRQGREELVRLRAELREARKSEDHWHSEAELLRAEEAKAQAELAALRQPILADDGRSLGQVDHEASKKYDEEMHGGSGWKEWSEIKCQDIYEAGAQAVAAVVLAQAVRRMEAVPAEEIARPYEAAAQFHASECGLEAVRARLIAAVKGEVQAPPVVVNEPPQNERQPDLSGESEKQDLGAMVKAAREAAIKGLTGPAWIPHDGGPCPLKDEDVEQFEFKIREGGVSGPVHVPNGWRWSNDDEAGDIIAYRVLKWKPGFSPEAKAEPAQAQQDAAEPTGTQPVNLDAEWKHLMNEQARKETQSQANNPLFSGAPVMLEARPSNIMLDLETLGTNPGCVILSIGAVLFGNGRLHEEFYTRISLKSSQESGLTIDADTLQWWTSQAPKVFAEALGGSAPLLAVLTDFKQWLTQLYLPKDWTIWSNGASFDAPVLEAAFRQLGIKPPWTHVQERCFRTLRALDPNEPKVEPVIKHHALEDAKAQALHAMRIAPWL